MSPVPSPAPTVPSRSRTLLAALVALLAAALLVPGAASAAKVRSLTPWNAQNTYRVEVDLDGRSAPRLKPVAKVDHVRAGQWVRITCQVVGQAAYGSRVWAKVNGLYVPDTYLKTYTDGFIQGVPTCGASDPKPAPPYVPAQPTAPSHATLGLVARAVEFEDVGGSKYGTYKKLYPSTRKDVDGHSINWGTNGCSVPEKLLEVELGYRSWKGKPIAYYSDIFEKSCDRHDFGYRNFGSKADGLELAPTAAGKKAVDSRFMENMNIQCKQKFDRKYVEALQRGICYKVADAFHLAVSRFGGKNYFD
ncbi:unannotated protein [freshwater metagenome]|uniref:Unannotated protein n=1 Tax=freshwater metagenome TaxID=449393 RepID=A0A6J7GQN5_9ZZZZ|nr:hypothetical protein [Actinomycetota bacterium]